jgi:hypothetical protein
MNKQSILLIMVGISTMIGFNIWLAQRDTQMWDKMDQEMINICSKSQQKAPECASYETVHHSPQTTL